MGHTDPGLALRIYAQAMRVDEDERQELRKLVEGEEFRPIKSDDAVAAEAESL